MAKGYEFEQQNPKCVCSHRLNLHRESDGKCVGRVGVFSDHCTCVRYVSQASKPDESR